MMHDMKGDPNAPRWMDAWRRVTSTANSHRYMEHQIYTKRCLASLKDTEVNG